MRPLTILHFFLSLILSSAAIAAEDWVYLKPEVGLGFTDNVYLDNSYRKSDFFARLRGSAKYRSTEADYLGRAGLNIYSQQTDNNFFNYSLNRHSRLNATLDLNLNIGGLSYVKSDLGASDESFNNFFVGASAVKDFSCGRLNCTFEPGIKITSYPHLSSRLDTNFYARLDSTWKVDSSTEINPYGEIGLVNSNSSYYTKNYLEFGLNWAEKLNSRYRGDFDFSVRSSSYPSRVVSQILIAPRPGNGNGNAGNLDLTLHEGTTLVQLGASVKTEDKNREYSCGLLYSTQSSVSHLSSYSELQLLAAINWVL